MGFLLERGQLFVTADLEVVLLLFEKREAGHLGVEGVILGKRETRDIGGEQQLVGQ